VRYHEIEGEGLSGKRRCDKILVKHSFSNTGYGRILRSLIFHMVKSSYFLPLLKEKSCFTSQEKAGFSLEGPVCNKTIQEEWMREYIQWHPAFFANLKSVFYDERGRVELESEHNISSKPMQIDVLLKKKENVILPQNIGRLFKKHNIIEYKGPEDYLSIDDYFKVYGYACFYKAETRLENEISAKDITLTFVCRRYPQKLIRYLQREEHLTVERQEEGIYYIGGGMFSIQLVVTSKLSEKKNFWLKYLTNDIKDKETAEKITHEYAKHQSDELYKSMMNVIVNANRELFKEVKQDMMCEALRELFKDELEAGMAQATAQGMAQGMAQGEEKERSTICRDIDRIMETCGMDAEKIVAGIKEYIVAKKAEQGENEVVV